MSAIAIRPTLWLTTAAAIVRLAPQRWWTRPPFLPVPHSDYLRFRTLTALGGDGSAAPTADDLIQWLQWCRHWPAAAEQS